MLNYKALNDASETPPNTPSCWSDYILQGNKDVLLAMYRQYNLRLDIQNCLEDDHQASALIVDQDKQIYCCQYLYDDNSLALNGDCLRIIYTEKHLVTIHAGNDQLFAILKKSFAVIPETELKPEQILQQLLLKVYDSTAKKLRLLSGEIVQLEKNTGLGKITPETDSLFKMESSLREAQYIVAGLQRLLQQLPADSGWSFTGTRQRCYSLLQAYAGNMEMLLGEGNIHLLDIKEKRELRRRTHIDSVLKSLLILGSIFMPIIFIAAVYSMRFENMPELKSGWGYILCLLFMAVVALIGWHRSKK